jgi:serine/threonine-protein kinase HipA
MNKIESVDVWMQGKQVGTTALTPDGLLAFEYVGSWLADGFSISPFELPLEPGVKIAPAMPFDGDFGVFDDALPDGWGLLILDRYLQTKGISPRSLSLLDRLAYVGSSGRGALEFRPDFSMTSTDMKADFLKMAKEVKHILKSDEYTGDSIDELWKRGGSPGGAHPKIFVKVDGKEWLVKFPARYDPANIGGEEYRYSLLAKECGVEMPETRLFENRYFGVERFDRSEEGERYHTVTAAGLLQVDYRTPCIDYVHLLTLCNQLTHSEIEMWKVYRVMVFNYLIGNKDDHAKNFTFIHRGGEWHFAPAYDLLPSEGMNGYHTTSFADSIEPGDEDILKVTVQSGLSRNRAKRVLEEMKDRIRTSGSASE